MKKDRLLVPVKLTPFYCLDLATNGFVLWGVYKWRFWLSNSSPEMEGRGLTILELRIVVIWERTPKNDKFRYCPQGGDTSLFTQDFLGSGYLFLHKVLS